MSMPMVICVDVGAMNVLIFSCPMLVIRGVRHPWYPFGPQGKERGDQTLTRSYPTDMLAIRPPFTIGGLQPVDGEPLSP